MIRTTISVVVAAVLFLFDARADGVSTWSSSSGCLKPIAPPAVPLNIMPPLQQESDPGGVRFGLRIGLGTDITGGLAYGVGANYLIPWSANALEVGVRFFGGSFEETTEEHFTYVETTNILVFALTADYLIAYSVENPGIYFVSGIGVGMIRAEWEERSDGDITLGTRLPGGGSMQSAEGSEGGLVLDVGIGYRLTRALDLRAEIPVFVLFDAPGNSSNVMPAFTVTVGWRF